MPFNLKFKKSRQYSVMSKSLFVLKIELLGRHCLWEILNTCWCWCSNTPVTVKKNIHTEEYSWFLGFSKTKTWTNSKSDQGLPVNLTNFLQECGRRWIRLVMKLKLCVGVCCRPMCECIPIELLWISNEWNYKNIHFPFKFFVWDIMHELTFAFFFLFS